MSTHDLVLTSIAFLKMCLLSFGPINHFILDWISAECDVFPGFVCAVPITVPSLSFQPSQTPQ